MGWVVYADPYLREVGALPLAQGDFAVGVENSFEIAAPASLGIGKGWYLMVEDTEYGGRVDGLAIDTADNLVTLSGRTWHGILEYEPIIPPPGQERLTVSGDANAVLAQLIDYLGLGWCMVADDSDSGFQVSNWGFSRLSGEMGGYTGIRKMLRSVGAKLRIRYDGAKRKAVLSAVARADYTEDGIDGDRVRFAISTTTPVNHLYCMGEGEGTARVVVNLYADAEGRVSKTQSIFGSGHKCEVYENPAADAATLEEDGAAKLAEYQAAMAACSLPEAAGDYDIDDIVGGTSTAHGVSVTTTIAEKIATVGLGGITDVETRTEMEVA